MRIIFCAAQNGKDRSGVVVVDGGGTQVYSLTFLIRVRAFVAVGTLAKCVSSFCVLLRAKMQRSLEQRYTIKFCAKLGESGSELCSC
jgi:hypothetical protein